jgi:phosphohistidine phosphatase
MDLLILMRHAKAVPEHDAPDDRSRALSPRGRLQAGEAAVALIAHDFRPDRALVSAAARTRETWAIAAPALGDPPVDFRETLYMAQPETIWAEALRAKAARVLIVAHNPGLHALAALLTDQACDKSRLGRSIVEGLSPASWAAFAISGDNLHAAGASLRGGWSPKTS